MGKRRVKPVNDDNLDLIGQPFRLPGMIGTHVIEAIHESEEGVVIALNPKIPSTYEVKAADVRRHLK